MCVCKETGCIIVLVVASSGARKPAFLGNLLHRGVTALNNLSPVLQVSPQIGPFIFVALINNLRARNLAFRGGLVFKAHRLLYHSTAGLRVIKKNNEVITNNLRARNLAFLDNLLHRGDARAVEVAMHLIGEQGEDRGGEGLQGQESARLYSG